MSCVDEILAIVGDCVLYIFILWNSRNGVRLGRKQVCGARYQFGAY